MAISWVGSLYGVFQKVDDFENYAVNEQPPTPWTVFTREGNFMSRPTTTVVEDPFQVGQGRVLAINPGVPISTRTLNQAAERALPQGRQIVASFPESKRSTLYFKVARPLIEGVPGEADLTWGIVAEEHRNPETGLHFYGSYSVLGRIESNGIIDIRDDTSYKDLMDEPLETQTYYEFWFIVDHLNFTFSQYIKGGNDYPEQTLLYEKAQYRNATWDALETILFISTAGRVNTGIKGKDDLYIDDIYIDVEGANLASPGVLSQK